MQLKLKRTVLQIDFLLVLFVVFGIILGELRQIGLLALSLFAHEFAHLAAARALNIGMHAIRLTPFGGLAQMENPYTISALRLCAVAAAGPLVNLVLILISAALCYWQILDILPASELIQINTLLMLFNLLPALPLDGGRILYALLSLRISRRKALAIGLWIGRALALALVLLALWGLLRHGQVNLSCLFAATFIFASAYDERRALDESRIRAFLNNIRPLSHPTRAKVIAVESTMSPQSILRSIHPDQVTLFAIYEKGHLTKIVDDRTLTQTLSHTSEDKSKYFFENY